jgi:hypothetical protein
VHRRSLFFRKIVVLWDWLGNVRRLPAEMDARRLSEIADLDAEVQRLKTPDKLVIFRFEKFMFARRSTTRVIILRARVLNRGPKTTLHQIRLTADNAISLSPVQNEFTRRTLDEIRLDPGDVQTANLEFNGNGIERNWALEFTDHLGIARREPIPKELYRTD